MTVRQTAGARLFVGTTATNAVTDTYTEIAEVTNIGDFGGDSEVVRHNPIATRKTQKFKGAQDDGRLELQLGRDISDAGQEALSDALDAVNAQYNFKITLDDKPDGATSKPTTILLKGKVFSFRRTLADVNSIYAATCAIEIDQLVSETAPITGS